MPLPEAPTLEFLEATETTIQVEFRPNESISTYELQWKPIEATWDSAASAAVQSSGTIKSCKTEAYNLEPGTTYCVRLVCVQDGEKGKPSKELILDTEQVGCAPKNEGGCGCIVQ